MRHANCSDVHTWARSLPRHTFKKMDGIPANGIYLLFERGERGHGGERVVRVGTHTGANQLPSRLRQHFLMANKDRSIFRKNIGRALLAKTRDPYAAQWERDLTSRDGKKRFSKGLDAAKQAKIEKKITKYLCNACSFVVVPLNDAKKRLVLESRLISTLSLCKACGPSKNWLGRHSPLAKIHNSGLWQVQHLYQTPLTAEELVYLQNA